MNAPRPHRWLWLVAFIGVCQLVGVVGALGTSTDTAWYDGLVKPAWNPPRWVFGPIWTTLYALMGLAAWRVWDTGRGGAALPIFFVQLGLNLAWSFVFFNAHAVDAALIEIAALWVAIVATMLAFWRVDRPAAWLMAPYLAWVTFAAALNASIAAMN